MIPTECKINDILTRDDGLEVKVLAVINKCLLDNDQQLYAISRGKMPNDPDTRFMQFDKIVTGFDLETLKFTKL